MTGLETLFSPMTIGSIEVRNRVLMLPMGLKFTTDGAPTPDDVEFFRARAEGGVGLVVMGGTIVHPTGQLRPRFFNEAFRVEHVERFGAVAEAVHGGGARIVGQLFHCGREALGESLSPLWAPSPIASPGTHQVPHEVTVGEIAELVEGFAHSARNLQDAGFDGVELHGAHGYIIGQFLSSEANHRIDGYGGERSARMRFLHEIIEAIRERCGRAFVLGVRMSGDDEVEGGIDLREATEIAAVLGGAGLVDYLSVAIGHRGTYVKDMSHRVGIAVRHAGEVRRASGLPVVAAQRIAHPALAEEVLRSGAADMIGMARALVADPEWVRKAKGGDAARILPCVGCVQDCRSHASGAGISCVHNPASGRELAWGPMRPVTEAKRVVVVGGGPGGLEAARVAALRGHTVTLLERHDRLGGQVRLAIAAPSRSELAGILTFRTEELERLHVDVRVGVEATPAVVAALQPDVVVVASGARAAEPQMRDANGLRVRTSWQVMASGPSDDALDGVASALVFDAGQGSWESFSAAEVLATRGISVIMATKESHVGARLPHETRSPWLRTLGSRCVELIGGCELVSTEDGVARLWDTALTVMRGEPVEREFKVDLVVECGRRVADAGPWAAIEDEDRQVIFVGDCVAPRDISRAVYEGQLAGRDL